MAFISAKDKLMILVTGKATLKEINELEKQAELEKEEPPKEEPPKDEPPKEEPPKDEPPKEEPPKDEPDEKDKRIAELEAQLKEAQAENVNGNSGGNEPSFDEQLESMFKDYRY